MSTFNWKGRLSRRLLVPVAAGAMLAATGLYEIATPATARAAATPAAAPLDDNSVNALLSLDQAMEKLAARVTPAIVNITVTARAKAEPVQLPEDFQRFFGPNGQQFFGHPSRPQTEIEHGLGSGVIISPDGYIVTNNHVVNGATDIRVTMSDRRIFTAKLVGTDPLTDLAVIKIDGTSLPSIPWGDSTKLHPGQTVLAFGNPLGLRFSVTRGIVSALNRPNPYSEDRRKPGQFIQTDAAINQGNSGGPLVDVRGEVVGINTFLISPSGAFSGMGFAIPTQLVRPIVDQIIKTGKVSHGYMGIAIGDVTPENAKFFDVNNATGALVSQVEDGSPAAKAGLKVGDVITELDGQKVTDASELQMQISEKEPGTKIELGVLRNGKSETIPVTLEALGNREKNANEA